MGKGREGWAEPFFSRWWSNNSGGGGQKIKNKYDSGSARVRGAREAWDTFVSTLCDSVRIVIPVVVGDFLGFSAELMTHS